MISSDMLLSSGLILIVFGTIFSSLKRLPGQIWNIFERHVFISLYLHDDDESFIWVKLWLGKKLEKSRSKSIFTKRKKDNFDYFDSEFASYKETNGIKKPQPIQVIAPGIYFFTFNGKLFWVNYERVNAADGTSSVKYRENFVIRGLTRNKSYLDKIIYQARDLAIPEDDKIEVRISNDGYLENPIRVEKRPLDSVILADNIGNNIVNDFKSFISSRKKYSNLGIPYRRGVLLYGTPGSGKSSLVLAIASELNLDVNIILLGDSKISDSSLHAMLSKTSEGSIILFEDIDCILGNRVKDKKEKLSGLTLSGLLNVIDGLSSQDGRIIFMTTNYISKLDKALIRPGRADLRYKLDNANKDQCERIFKRFYPDSLELAQQFSDQIPEYKLPMSAIQNHLMNYYEKPLEAISNTAEMVSYYLTVEKENENDKAN